VCVACAGHDFCLRSAGAAILPASSALRGAVLEAVSTSDGGGAEPVVFATAGERGALKLWRSDTGCCLAEHGCAQISRSLFSSHV
jgi:hypothetical protein